MKTPGAQDLQLAALWLESYEGQESDSTRLACERVAAWLLKQAEATEFRQACRDAGVSVATGRRAARAAGHRP